MWIITPYANHKLKLAGNIPSTVSPIGCQRPAGFRYIQSAQCTGEIRQGICRTCRMTGRSTQAERKCRPAFYGFYTSWPNKIYTTDIDGNRTDSTVYAKGKPVKTYAGLEPRLTVRYSLNDQPRLKLRLPVTCSTFTWSVMPAPPCPPICGCPARIRSGQTELVIFGRLFPEF